MPEPQATFLQADAINLPLADNSVDLVFGSPPYEARRQYAELEFDKRGPEWVRWAADVFSESLRVCRGLVAWICEGVTESFEYSATPFLLMAELQKRGYKLRKPAVYRRVGIPGSGGPDFLRNDWEPIIMATKEGRLPWADNTACGTTPVNPEPRYCTYRLPNGDRVNKRYEECEIANPGNVIDCTVGSGHLGWSGAHENEAPFPQSIAEFFVKSFCQPGGIVLDPFSGSGTTVAAAVACGRNGIGVDVRPSQVWLGQTRVMGLTTRQRRNGQGLLF